MYYIIYKTTNLINGKYYIGKHQTENLDDGYLGSGVALKKAIKKYGKENFNREIICFCENDEEMDNKEIEIVDSSIVEDPNSYNLGLGGEGGAFFKGKTHSKEVREFLAENNWAITEDGRRRLSEYALAHREEYSIRSKNYWSHFSKNEMRSEMVRRKAMSLRKKDIKKYGYVLMATEDKISDMYWNLTIEKNFTCKTDGRKNNQRETSSHTRYLISKEIKRSWNERYLQEAKEIEQFFEENVSSEIKGFTQLGRILHKNRKHLSRLIQKIVFTNKEEFPFINKYLISKTKL